MSNSAICPDITITPNSTNYYTHCILRTMRFLGTKIHVEQRVRLCHMSYTFSLLFSSVLSFVLAFVSLYLNSDTVYD